MVQPFLRPDDSLLITTNNDTRDWPEILAEVLATAISRIVSDG